MSESYYTVYEGHTGEVVEKKSRFIAEVSHVETEEEAAAFVEAVRKKYYDARHHCFAYIVGKEKRLMRSSDDGEPQGTAGRPILDTLTGMGLCDVVLVVTRYFGGTLLGTGGLVRAYTAAARSALDNSEMIEKKTGILVELVSDYGSVGKLQYVFREDGLPVLHSEYTDKVTFQLIVPDEKKAAFEKKIQEISSGKIPVTEKGPVLYAERKGQILYDPAG